MGDMTDPTPDRVAIYKLGPGGRAQARAEQRIAERVGCEQVLNALTPPHKRNPPDAAKAVTRDGYAVYDGPAAVQPSQ